MREAEGMIEVASELRDEIEPAPLEWWMRDYVRHLRHHLAQLLGD
jgi:hypothetical protein